ncbi:MAG: hypothetical protein ACK4L7_00145 [Flavobacteriales bacterium]
MAAGQPDTVNVPHSSNGCYLSPHGTIRVLVLFCELEYDKTPSRDPQPDGAEHWPKGRLPKWADDLFDPHPAAACLGRITRYYRDMSMGRFTVLGDYIDTILTIRESEHPTLGNAHGIGALAVKEANELGALRTRHRLGPADFDMWKRGGQPGMPKQRGPDSPHSYDHVMVIARNSGLTHNQGSTDPGSPGKLFGFESDSQSRFGGMWSMPFEILQHEFNHLLFGGNNFHAGGGNANIFTRYFTCMQGGWSMMGGSNSSLLTCNAWDRRRLGWTLPGSPFAIPARDAHGAAVNGDLDPLEGDTGVFVLRDFITTGDALRIRLPYLGEKEYPQWLWLENHQTAARNGVPSDRFHYEAEMPCVKAAVPGIYAYVQVDRERMHGRDIQGGHADYLRAVPASGFHDYALRGDTVQFQCLWPGPTAPLVQRRALANPLSGASELEITLFDTGKEELKGVVPRIIIADGNYEDASHFFGHARQAFVPGKHPGLGLGTNPPLANMLTFTHTQGRPLHPSDGPDNRTVHLADIAVELLEQRADGAIAVRVARNRTRVSGAVRFCADSIVLHPPLNRALPALHAQPGAAIRIDRGRTPTRWDRPEKAGGKRWFSAPTRLTLLEGARIAIDARAKLTLENGSVLHALPGSRIELHRKARLQASGDSRIVLHGDARIDGTGRQLRRLERSGRMLRVP